MDRIEIDHNSCGWYIKRGLRYSEEIQYLLKNFTWCNGYEWAIRDISGSSVGLGYYPTEAIVQAYLDEYLSRNQVKGEQKMIKLSNGVKVSEDTIVSALKKAGINVELPEPKHIFKAGDVIEINNRKRIIVNTSDGLQSVASNGLICLTGQREFENCGYKFIGRLADLLK